MVSDLYFLGSIPVIGAASAIVLDKVTSPYGRTFGTSSRVLIGLIGAVQNAASFVFALLFIDRDRNMRDNWRITKIMVLSHVCTALTLACLTAVAAKVNLVSERLSLFATILLAMTSLIENCAVTGIEELTT